MKQVPVVLVDLSEEQAHLLNLALNRISGSWDQELLARLLSDLNAVPDVDLSLTGFSDEELQKHLRSLDGRENSRMEKPTAVCCVAGCCDPCPDTTTFRTRG